MIPHDAWVREQLLLLKESEDPNAAILKRIERLSNQPDDHDNIRRLAQLYEQINDRAHADQYYDLLLEKNPDDQSIALEVSKHYRDTDRPDRSLQIVTQYAQSRSTPQTQANATILIATHHIALKQLDKAEDVLLESVKNLETPELLLSLAEFYLKSLKHPRDALPWLNKAA